MTLPLDVGDCLSRALPNGSVEEFLVDDPGFQNGFGPIPARFLVTYRKRSAALEQGPLPDTKTYKPGQLHAEIEKVSGSLFRDGHYKPAALEAYIRVINEVRGRSGLALDGDPLMSQAFGCDNRLPVIQFNELETDADRDEQKAFSSCIRELSAFGTPKLTATALQ